MVLLYEDSTDAAAAKTAGIYPTGPVKSWLKIGKNRYGVSGSFVTLNYFKCHARFDLWTGA